MFKSYLIKVKILSTKFKENNYFERLGLLAFILLLPCVAQAQSAGNDEVITIVNNICTYLSGTVARAMGVLAIIFLGYKTIHGQMDWRRAGSIAVGMGLIIGGAYYGTVLWGGA